MPQDKRFKMGSCSILIGERWHMPPFTPKPGKLLRISKPYKRHNDAHYLDIIRTIPEYSKLYSIPDKETFTMTDKDEWWQKFKATWGKIGNIEALFRPGTTIVCQYIPDAGLYDVIDALTMFSEKEDRSVWDSYASIWRMAQQIASAINFLHDKQLCHLDIKGENVMISNDRKTYRLIDFGFCSKEPFSDFIKDPRGTPGYFPKQISCECDPGLPIIYANDMNMVNGRLPMEINPKFVYLIDTFCFGRLVNYVFYTYKYRTSISCLWWEKKGYRRKLQDLLERVLEPDVYKRPTISEVQAKGLLS